MNPTIIEHPGGFVEIQINGDMFVFTKDQWERAKRLGDSVLKNRRVATSEEHVHEC